MKNKHNLIFIGIGVLLVIIALVVGIVLLTKDDEDIKYYDDGIDKGVPLEIYKENIKNESKVPYKKGDRINVIVKCSELEYDYEKNPYFENVMIYDIKDDSIYLWISNDAYPILAGLQDSPLLTLEIEKATDKNGEYKFNKELYDLLYDKFSVKSEENN